MRISPEHPLVLGSASPRRREILENVRVPHVVVAVDVDETRRDGETPDAYLVRVVVAKLDAVRASLSSSSFSWLGSDAAAVLTADTSVIDGADVLGKPKDTREACETVTRLAGRTHEVHTRFALAPATPGAPVAHAETVVTRVTFRPLTPAEARAYAESGEGLDKAGAYAVQGLGASIVSRVDGSYTNVVGLPACEVVVALGRLGLW